MSESPPSTPNSSAKQRRLKNISSTLHPALIEPMLEIVNTSARSSPRVIAGNVNAINDRSALDHKIREHIQGLTVVAYEQLIAQLLQSLGYSTIAVLRASNRQRRSRKGRNSHGGVDITARKSGGLSEDLILVQVKQYNRPVPRRFVDELRGAMLRQEARHGLLITTSTFSPVAYKAAHDDHIVPVHLLNGTGLIRLLIWHGLGVKRTRRGKLRFDRQFFQQLSLANGGAPSYGVGEKNTSVSPLHRKLSPGGANFSSNRRNVVFSDRHAQEGGGMMGRTHAFVGIVALWLLEPFGLLTQGALPPLLMIAVLGALLPDLDAAESKIKRLSLGGVAPFMPLSQVLHHTLGHRGLLHSLMGLIIVTAICALPLGFWLGWTATVALALGYASHLLADAATKSGIPLLYPRRQRFHLLPKGWRFTTGSQAEEMLLPWLALGALLLLFVHFPYI